MSDALLEGGVETSISVSMKELRCRAMVSGERAGCGCLTPCGGVMSIGEAVAALIVC